MAITSEVGTLLSVPEPARSVPKIICFDVRRLPPSPTRAQEAGKPPLKPEVMLELLSKRINHHELVQGAIFDLLFSQCDRHQQNIFLTETGKFWLIDTDRVGVGAGGTGRLQSRRRGGRV
jgi:hypothetical protein